MFELKKICDEYEQLNSVERGLILTEKSVKILATLKLMDLPGIDPVSTLAGFIIGSVVADGKVNEQEYLLIYPALIQTFGYNFDLHAIKQEFGILGTRKLINEYTDQMIRLFDLLSDDLKNDVIMLCLCITSMDEKISLKEKRYLRRLFRL